MAQCNHVPNLYYCKDSYCDNIKVNFKYEYFSFLFYECHDGTLFSFSAVGNNISDCRGGEDEKSMFHIRHSITKPVPPTPKTEHCIFDKYQQSQILFCMFYECPFHFKCKNSYCIPHKYVCDLVFDCPNGEDEKKSLCLNHTCPGMFKCVYANVNL